LLDRPTEWFGHSLTQTLEPRLIYARTPWRDLSRTPNFDSARLDFNTSSLTSPNAFSGVDWVSEADQVTLDLSSRVLDANSGAQLASMGVAQRYVLRDLREAPDGQQPARGFSDLYLLGSLSAIERWNLSSSVQYKLDTQQVVRSISSVGYTPGPYRTVTVSHSLQRGASEQVAVGWQWPLRGPAGVPERTAAGTPAEIAPASAVAAALDSRRTAARSSACEGTLYGVGKLDYSTLARRLSSALVGLEYDAGCWIGRVVVERQSTGSATYSNRLMLQLELSGLSRLGSNPLGVLKDSIPGYLLLRDPRADRGAATSNPSGSTGLNTTP
ncbi:MAG: LPS-assembly protein LptD, partial [Leptothrix sp. (in: b-proteobacteria)]